MPAQMTHSEAITFMKAAIPAGLPVMLSGAPGIGKTELIEEAARQCGADVLLSHPVVSDPTDAKGLPAKISDSEAAFLPFGDLLIAMKATRPTVWFLDDLGQAAPAVQASYMQLLLKREINGKRISDNVTFAAATNRRKDRAGVQGILEPVKSRFASIIELKLDFNEWCNWAMENKLPVNLIAFIRFMPDALCDALNIDYKPSADMENSASPRTWYKLSQIEALGLPTGIEHQAMAGSVGEKRATDYLSFRKMAKTLQSIDSILAAPDKARLPNNPGEAYAISTALAARANDKTISRIGTYITRLAEAEMGEFAALSIRDCLRRDTKLANSPDYVKIMCGPVGQLISGQAVR